MCRNGWTAHGVCLLQKRPAATRRERTGSHLFGEGEGGASISKLALVNVANRITSASSPGVRHYSAGPPARSGMDSRYRVAYTIIVYISRGLLGRRLRWTQFWADRGDGGV